VESVSKLKPAFRKDGTIKAGNAPGLNSGAAAMVVADRAWAEKKGVEPMARLVAHGLGAVEPGMFGLGPVPAVKQALERAGWKAGDVQRIEINEAFAAIVITVTKDLGLSQDIVNVEGGAIAHGHPIGATGAALTTRLLHSMHRDGIKRGSSRCVSAADKASHWRLKPCNDQLQPTAIHVVQAGPEAHPGVNIALIPDNVRV
jgi:acetyl-CoA C-acetyltransferase